MLLHDVGVAAVGIVVAWLHLVVEVCLEFLANAACELVLPEVFHYVLARLYVAGISCRGGFHGLAFLHDLFVGLDAGILSLDGCELIQQSCVCVDDGLACNHVVQVSLFLCDHVVAECLQRSVVVDGAVLVARAVDDAMRSVEHGIEVFSHGLVPESVAYLASIQQPCQASALHVLGFDVRALRSVWAVASRELEPAISGQVVCLVLVVGHHGYAPAVLDGGTHVAFPCREGCSVLCGCDFACGVAAGDVALATGVGVSDETCRGLSVAGDVALHAHSCDVHRARPVGVSDESAAILDASHGAAGVDYDVREVARRHRSEETCSRFVPVHLHAADGMSLSVYVAPEYLRVVAYGSPIPVAQIQVGHEAQVHLGLSPVDPLGHQSESLSAADEHVSVGILLKLSTGGTYAELLVEQVRVLFQFLACVAVDEVILGRTVAV